MKKYTALLLILALLFGCVSRQIQASKRDIDSIKKILVIPMEPPPLHLPPSVSSAQMFSQSLNFSMIPESAYQTGGGVGALVFGIFMIAELPEAAKRSAKISMTLEGMLSSEEAWIPTIVLAKEAANKITSLGAYEVTVRPGFQTYPGVTNRENTWHLENWLRSIRHWYNEDTSVFEYKELKHQGIDGVLEVALSNYEIAPGNVLLIQVMIKLVEPSTGKVLGKARSFAWPSIGEADTLFDNQGQRFKELFATTGEELVNNALKDIGFISDSSDYNGLKKQ